MLRQPRSRAERLALDTPPAAVEYASAFGPIRAVKVPHAIHDAMVKLQLHHLGDYIDEEGGPKQTKATLTRYVHYRTAQNFMGWFQKYKHHLVEYLDEDIPRWQRAPKTWDIAPPANVRTETVVGACLAKQEKTQRVVHSGKLYDVELGHYDRQLARDQFALYRPCS